MRVYVCMSPAILVGAGVAMFPIGWSNWEVRQVCGATASPYNMGEFICDIARLRTKVGKSGPKLKKSGLFPFGANLTYVGPQSAIRGA